MRLKRLELFGFKSFADRTVLNFEHDLIGIVGPNGCGKSNVVDAVRWILGEQRAKSMRGDEMTDVIFKGSVSRPRLSMAEGTISFDNSGGALEGHGDEVSVTRRVYASGEGEYLIDGSRVRLKDVREMLFGTGLGSRGYSVLEQGKIDAILSANAFERRAIFEEAAGVSRYRQRKKETESRLKRVQNDLLRLEDVIGELEKRERSLKIQAGKARRFVEARETWRVDGGRLARHQLHFLAETIAETARALQGLEEQVETQRRHRGAAEEDILAREKDLVETSEGLETTTGELSDLSAEIRGAEERLAQLSARVDAWRASSEDERQRAESLEVRHKERVTQSEELGGQLTELETVFEAAKARVQHFTEASLELTQQHQSVAREAQEKNDRVLSTFEELNSTRNRLQHLEQSLEPLARREQRATERLEGAETEVRTAEEREQEASDTLREAEARLAQAVEARDACEQEGQALDERLDSMESRRSELELTCARLASRVESLRDWEREREGLESGARALLDAVEAGTGPALDAELRGLFADHIHVETRIARALDAALGERAQALVVDSHTDALALFSWLKSEEQGRVSVVVPPCMSSAADAPDSDSTDGKFSELPAELLAAEGVEGSLLALCRPEEGVGELARALIGDVLLVASIQRALDLVATYPHLRFVTPEGDLVDAAGLRGGHTEVAQGAVGRRSTADELDEERAGNEEELASTAQAIATERERRRGTAARLSELREASSVAGAERARALSQRDSQRVRLEELLRGVKLSEHECAGLAHERSEIQTELETTGARRAELATNYEQERSGLEDLEARRKMLEEERGERAREEGEARVEAAGSQERRDALRRRRADLEETCEELSRELERARRLTGEHRANADAGAREVEELAQRGRELEQERTELGKRVEELRIREREGREGIEGLRRKAEGLTGQLEQMLGRVSETRLEKQRHELARDEIARRVEEDFGKPAHEFCENYEPEEELAESAALAELEARVLELKQQLEKLGPVNLEAVEELEEVSERLTFLTTQRQDLNEARRVIEGTLEQLNRESEQRFIEAFDEISTGFKVLFRQLFGGGRAEITLMDKDDVLECGIQIIARPPGREALPISLLSGGQRTLTALALLFAVFQRNSSPFCILDEVDAALDDANIGRFLSMLENNLSDTQYIIVTHNKGTMSACEVLYGVTMATKGVSNVVSVELGAVDEIVPEAQGRSAPRLVADVSGAPAAEAEASEPEIREVVLIPGVGMQED